MKSPFSLLLIFFLFTGDAFGQKVKKEKDVSGDHYLIKGRVFKIDPAAGTEENASNVQVVVYQGSELFVTFFTGEQGDYEFYLPIGFMYEVWYGGSAYVNKKVHIDATQFPKERKPRTVPLDMGLFRPVEKFEFPMLNAPYVKIGYDPELDQIAPDMEYTAKRSAELEKVFKKIKKTKPKKKK